MRRWLFIAALSAALLITPVWAQRGGGGHGGMSGGGGHAGFSGGGGVAHGGGYAAHSGAAYGYRGSVGYARVPSYAGAPRAGSYWAGGARGWNGNQWHGNGYGWRGNGWHRPFPYRPYGFGYGRFGYPYWGFGYAGWAGYPWWGWYGGLGWDYDDSYYGAGSYAPAYNTPSYPSYVYVTPGDSNYDAQEQTQQEQIDSLNNEVTTLRAQQQQNLPQGKTTEIRAEAVLIYRDGHAEEVQNYAIVGKTIWVFDEARARKVPISQLDLPATKRDNEDRGINFVVPDSSR
jgi:hypothetical protein